MKLPSIIFLSLAALPLAGCGENSAPDPARAAAICTSCHSFEKNGARRAGPNLFGIVDKTAGSEAGFNYSLPMKASGIIWTPEKLEAFLAAPQQLVPGNRMAFSGISDASQRKAVVDHLTTLK